MFNSYKPNRTDSNLDYNFIRNLYYNNKKMMNTRFDSRYFRTLEDSTGRFISLSTLGVGASADPWQIMNSPTVGLPVASAWRTIQIHSATLNNTHPRKDVSNTYADDTETDTTKKDIVLDASKKYFICVYQTYDTSTWEILKTAIFIKEDTGSNEPFVGWINDHNVFRNVLYYQIGRVETSNDTLKNLTITEQTLNSNFEQIVVTPEYWEPIATTTDALSPASTDWRTFKIYRPGFLTPTLTITDISTAVTLTAGATTHFYLNYTIDEDDGTATACELDTGSTIPTPTTPDPGLAPTTIYRLLASVEVPSSAGKSTVTVATDQEELSYQIATVGYDVNTSGEIVNLYAGYFF
jgi:hypothetical protein